MVNKKNIKKNSLDVVNPLNKLFFCWVGRVIKMARKSLWQQDMHQDLSRSDTFRINFCYLRKKIFIKKKLSLFSIIARRCIPQIVLMLLTVAIIACSNIAVVYCVRDLVKLLLSEDTELIKKNYQKIGVYLAVIGFTPWIGNTLKNYTNFNLNRAAAVVQSTLYGIVLEKSMKRNILNSSEHSSGAILNYIQVDLPKFETFFTKWLDMILSVVMILSYYVYMYFLIDFGMFVVLGVASILAILNSQIFKLRISLRRKLLNSKDKRMSFMKNIITNLKYIKMRALENLYHYRLSLFRDEELRYLWILSIVSSMLTFLIWMIPATPTVAIIYYQGFIKEGLYTFDNLSAYIKVAFDSIQYVIAFPDSLNTIFDWYISLKRVEKFLHSEEIDNSWIEHLEFNDQSENSVELRGANFYWNNDEYTRSNTNASKNMKRKNRTKQI